MYTFKSIPIDAPQSIFLRETLLANGVFSGLAGFLLILGAQPLAVLMGIPYASILLAVGLSLLLYAAGLIRNSLRRALDRAEAWIACILDAGWVAMSGALIFSGLLSSTGNWVVALTADVVLVFAILQLVGLRRLHLVTAGRSENIGARQLSGKE